jgi:hypothetical protein
VFCITSDKAGRRWVLTLAGIFSTDVDERLVQVVAGAFLAGLVSIISKKKNIRLYNNLFGALSN